MALGYECFDSYDSVGYVLTLHISPHTVCSYKLPIHIFLLAEKLCSKGVLAILGGHSHLSYVQSDRCRSLRVDLVLAPLEFGSQRFPRLGAELWRVGGIKLGKFSGAAIASINSHT